MIDVEATVTSLKRLYGDGRKMCTNRCWICRCSFGFYFVRDPIEIRYDPGCYCRAKLLATDVTTMDALREFIAIRPLRARAWIKFRERELAARMKLEQEQREYWEAERKKRRAGRLPFPEMVK